LHRPGKVARIFLLLERLSFNIITLQAEFGFTAGFRRSGMGANVAEFRG